MPQAWVNTQGQSVTYEWQYTNTAEGVEQHINSKFFVMIAGLVGLDMASLVPMFSSGLSGAINNYAVQTGQIIRARGALQAQAMEQPVQAQAMSQIAQMIQLRARQLDLSFNAGAKGPNLAEGLGKARYEQFVGRTIQNSLNDPSYDFVDPAIGRVSLKGPISHNVAGQPIVIDQKMINGLVNSAADDARYNTATSRLVVDMYGLTAEQRQAATQGITAQVGANARKDIVIIH
jgi:hypothetical protein